MLEIPIKDKKEKQNVLEKKSKKVKKNQKSDIFFLT